MTKTEKAIIVETLALMVRRVDLSLFAARHTSEPVKAAAMEGAAVAYATSAVALSVALGDTMRTRVIVERWRGRLPDGWYRGTDLK